MTVKFDQVEVLELRQHSNTNAASVHTKKVYPIDSFELERKDKRRTITQFHRSDLYREEIWIAKLKKAQGVTIFHHYLQEKPFCKRQIFEVDENKREHVSSPSPSEKIRKIGSDKKKTQRSRRKHLFQRQRRRSSLKSSLMPIRESMSIVF